MMKRNKLRRVYRMCWVICALLATGSVNMHAGQQAATRSTFRGALLAVADVSRERLAELKENGTTAVILPISMAKEGGLSRQTAAADLVLQSGLKLGYWLEIARCVELADTHPEWMASLQTHDEWRRHFPNARTPADDEVTKAYPWVPILSREPFRGQLDRVKRILADRPMPQLVFLNDLQGAPSACGCGNPLCRWTSDYGKRRTTTPLGDDAAALFVSEVQKLLPNSSAVIPVWTTECEKHDGASDGLCAGVGCFDGICWKAFTRQLMPLERTCARLAVLVPFREFQRDVNVYGERAGWVRHAIASFATIPPQHGGKAVPATRLIAVLQGWDVSQEDLAAQVTRAEEAGAHGYVVAYDRIEQGWQPKVVRWR